MTEFHTENRTPVALYVRDSDNGGDSITAKLMALREYAGGNGMVPVVEYVDRQGSREQFGCMMSDGTGENPTFRRILVNNFAQFSRSVEEWTEWQARLEANGVQVISVTERPDGTRTISARIQGVDDRTLGAESQREQVSNYAEQHNMEIVEEFVD